MHKGVCVSGFVIELLVCSPCLHRPTFHHVFSPFLKKQNKTVNCSIIISLCYYNHCSLTRTWHPIHLLSPQLEILDQTYSTLCPLFIFKNEKKLARTNKWLCVKGQTGFYVPSLYLCRNQCSTFGLCRSLSAHVCTQDSCTYSTTNRRCSQFICTSELAVFLNAVLVSEFIALWMLFLQLRWFVRVILAASILVVSWLTYIYNKERWQMVPDIKMSRICLKIHPNDEVIPVTATQAAHCKGSLQPLGQLRFLFNFLKENLLSLKV